MWGQSSFGLFGVFAVISCFTSPISGKTGFLHGKDSLTPTSCVLNTRTPNPLDPQTFFHCTATGPTLMKCPETMIFEASTSSCVKGDADTSKSSVYVPNCARAWHGAFFPAYCDCNKFWRCFYQYPILFSCGEGTYWSQQSFTCTYPDQSDCQVDKHQECKEGDIKGNSYWEHPTFLADNMKELFEQGF